MLGPVTEINTSLQSIKISLWPPRIGLSYLWPLQAPQALHVLLNLVYVGIGYIGICVDSMNPLYLNIQNHLYLITSKLRI